MTDLAPPREPAVYFTVGFLRGRVAAERALAETCRKVGELTLAQSHADRSVTLSRAAHLLAAEFPGGKAS